MAQTAAQPVIAGPPDVLVIVFQQPGGADQVGVTYAGIVPHAQAVQDFQALTQAAKWPVSAPVIHNASGPMKNFSAPSTSATFQALGVIQDSAHTFPIETFSQAFHKYRRLKVVFFTGPQFQFQGVRSYADSNIKMALMQNGTSYTYDVEILNPNSGSLPLVGPSAPAGTSHRSPLGIFLGIFGGAALVGLAVYLLTSRFTPRQSPPKAKSQDGADQETEDLVELGTKGH